MIGEIKNKILIREIWTSFILWNIMLYTSFVISMHLMIESRNNIFNINAIQLIGIIWILNLLHLLLKAIPLLPSLMKTLKTKIKSLMINCSELMNSMKKTFDLLLQPKRLLGLSMIIAPIIFASSISFIVKYIGMPFNEYELIETIKIFIFENSLADRSENPLKVTLLIYILTSLSFITMNKKTSFNQECHEYYMFYAIRFE